MDKKTFIINTYSEDKYRELSSRASDQQLHIVDNDELHRTVVPSYDLLVDKVKLGLGYDIESTEILLKDVDGNVISRLPANRFISDNYLMSAAYDEGKLILSVLLSNDEVNAISVDFPVDQTLDPLSDYVESTYPIASKAVAGTLISLSSCISDALVAVKNDMTAADKTLSDMIQVEVERATTEENAISERLEETKAELTEKIDKDIEEAKNFFDDKLATEAHDRFGADQSLRAQITTEVERAEDVESTLDEKINETSVGLIEKIEDPLIARYIENDTRRHLILRNHDNILGELSSGIPINLAMVSKWNIADFGSIAARMNLNTLSTDDIVTINDKLSVATTDDVQSALADANSYADAKVDSSLEALSGTWKADNKHIVDQVTQTDGQVSVIYKALTITEVSGLQDQLDSKTTKEEVENVSSALSIDYVEKISDAITDEHVVKYADGDSGRKHIKLKNYDSITGYLSGENASDVNLAMVSKWNVADFGSKTIPLNLNAVDAVVTINDSLTVATTDDVSAKLDAVTFENTKVNGHALSTDVVINATDVTVGNDDSRTVSEALGDLSEEISEESQRAANIEDEISGKVEQKVWIKNPDSEMYADGAFSNLSVVKLTAEEYYQKVADYARDNITLNDGTLYVLSSNEINAYGEKIINVATPTAAADAANKEYIDTRITAIINALSSVTADTVDQLDAKMLAEALLNLKNALSSIIA